MVRTRPDLEYSPEPGVFERRALTYLKRRAAEASSDSDRQGPAQRAALQRVKRTTLIWAATSGAVSGAVIGGVEVFLRFGLLDGMEDMEFREQLPYWIGFYAFVGLVSLIEILFLYWSYLQAAARFNSITGAALEREKYSELVTIGLARAALEFPNPRSRVFGIDPYALMPRWRMLLKTVLYKAKVGLSGFVVRIVLRRVIGRMAVRGFIPLFAIPLYVLWNFVITWRIMREAGLRVVGPLAIETLMEQVSEQRDRLSAQARETILRGVGEVLVNGHNAHPNLIYLLSHLLETFDAEDETIELDWSRQREVLRTLEPHEHAVVLNVMTLAVILGSKVGKNQKRVLMEAHEDCGETFEPEALKRARKALVAGQWLEKGEPQGLTTLSEAQQSVN